MQWVEEGNEEEIRGKRKEGKKKETLGKVGREEERKGDDRNKKEKEMTIRNKKKVRQMRP